MEEVGEWKVESGMEKCPLNNVFKKFTAVKYLTIDAPFEADRFHRYVMTMTITICLLN